MQPQPYPFAAVLFDLDGVIVDSTEIHYRAWTEFARELGHTPSASDLLAANGRRAGETIRAWFGDRFSDEEIAALVREKEARANRLLATSALPTIPGVRLFVEALVRAGVPRAVATSAVPANAELALERAGLRGAFDVVVTAADVSRGKPAPDPWLLAASRLGVAPGACLVVEDAVSGIRAAKAAGARCLALATTFPRERLAAEGPDWIATDFTELPPELVPQAVPARAATAAGRPYRP